MKSISLFAFGGVAQIAGDSPSASAELLIAVAGPLTSFALSGVFYLVARAVVGIAPVLAAAKYLAYVNAVLAAFNLIPGVPLDGGRVFRAVVIDHRILPHATRGDGPLLGAVEPSSSSC